MIRSILILSVFFTSLQINAQCSFSISGGGSVCTGGAVDVIFDLTGTAPWEVVYSIDGIQQTLLVINSTPHTVTLNTPGLVVPVSVSDNTGCNGTVSGSAEVVINDPPAITNVSTTCNTDKTEMVVEFTISGGDPSSYVVTPFGSGTLALNVFTSNPIPVGNNYQFLIDDANNCGPVSIDGMAVCECETEAGQMQSSSTSACGTDPITVDYDDTSEFLDSDDIRQFIVHTQNGIPFGDILAAYTTPEIPFDANIMNFGVTYYVTAIFGNDDGSGNVDLTDPCFTSSTSTSIVFYEQPVMICIGDITLDCISSTSTLECTVTGGVSPYTYTWTGPNGFNSILPFPAVQTAGIYQLIVTDVNGCTTEGEVSVFEDTDLPLCTIQLSSAYISCNTPSITASFDCPSPNNNLAFLWSDGQTTPTATFTAPGTYTATVTDLSTGCTVTTTILIEQSFEGCGFIKGQVLQDINEDCLNDPMDEPMQSWMIRASGNQEYFGWSNAAGEYEIAVVPGDYTVAIIHALPGLWSTCEPSVDINLPAVNEVIEVDFLQQVEMECPLMEVDISAPMFRRCFTNHVYVNYCNAGTIAADDVFIEVNLDPLFIVNFASANYTNPSPGLYVFDIGDVDAGECDVITFNTTLSCDADLGATLCNEAHIFPDSLCVTPNPLWSGASLEVTAECDGSEVTFTITNVGDEDMNAPSHYIVIEDGVMLHLEPEEFQLLAGGTTQESFPANGSTYVIDVDQVAFHPGFSAPLAAVEGCGTNGIGEFSMGFVNQFPENDADPFISIDCQTVIGAYDPNDKYGYPAGFGAENYIDLGQDLEYRIRFQNTGTDTAFNVVIEDVLSPFLDITTLRPGVSSHPYELTIHGKDTLLFAFENIMLPDSNINEPASHGFVKFRIQQMPTTELGDLIENEAGIYFDFNDPVITNKTKHLIGDHYLLTTTTNVSATELQHFLHPNPSSGETTLYIKGEHPTGELQFELFDINGRSLVRHTFSAPSAIIDLGNISQGMYYYKISQEEHQLGIGKIMRTK